MDYILTLLFLIPSLWLSLLLHEASHAVMAKHNGAKIVTFKPFPHSINGTFYFGRTSWVLPEGKKLSRWVYAAPLFTDWVLVVLGIGFHLLWIPAIAISLAGVIDAAWWVRGYFGWFSPDPTKLDGYRFKSMKS